MPPEDATNTHTHGGGARDGGDISDALRREFVRQTIVGIVTSTRTVNAEAACASPVYNASAMAFGGGASIEQVGGLRQGELATPLLSSDHGTALHLHNAAPGGDEHSLAQLVPSHFAEVSTLELAEGVFFQDYAPLVWQALRQTVYHVPYPEYLRSLMGTSAEQMEEFIETMVGNFSEGGSGGFFFLSADRRYLIKTLTRAEQQQLLRMLPRYFEYMRASPRTLLCRFFGCYSITMHGQSVWFVAMESLFHAALTVHEKYDLKGSWVDRSAHPERAMARTTRPRASSRSAAHVPGASDGNGAITDVEGSCGEGNVDVGEEDGGGSIPRAAAPQPLPTRKDNDMSRKLRLPPHVSSELHAQCRADAALLRSMDVMDYSLLLGVHHQGSPNAAQPLTPNYSNATSTEGPLVFHSAPHEDGAVYYLSIIDLLQTWTLAKRFERFFKVALCCRCGASAAGMSAVEPEHYARRFLLMIERILDLQQECNAH